MEGLAENLSDERTELLASNCEVLELRQLQECDGVEVGERDSRR